MARRKKAVTGDPGKAVAYIRTSTDDQANSPAAQRHDIEAWATREGVHVEAWHVDTGISGSAPVDRRPGLTAALSALRTHGAGVLVVSSRCRLARDVVIAAVATKLTLDAGAVIRSADGAGDGDSPEAELMRMLLDSFAQYERSRIRGRTKAALAAKRRRGEKIGDQAPYGWRHDGDRTVPHPREQKTVDTIRSLRAQGLSIAAIAKRLNEHARVHPPRGKRWHATSIARILNAVPA
jgi:DNA invertase Pin-like site-specific DNA recombinase